jgi:uracil-DNA glycosylase
MKQPEKKKESLSILSAEVKATKVKSSPGDKRLVLETELNRLHQSIRRCSKCFPRGGNCPVAGTGPAQKGGLFLIGQAPGIREPAAQKNFAWTAGRRLFSWFGTIGVSEENIRAHAYITAVTKCYPGKAAHGKGDRKPSPTEVENCAPYLEKALKLLSPSVLVLIGGLAIERFLGPNRFSEVIGKEFEKNLIGGKAWVVPVPHPSGASPWPYLPGNKQKLNKAFRLIKQRLQRQKLFSEFLH